MQFRKASTLAWILLGAACSDAPTHSASGERVGIRATISADSRAAMAMLAARGGTTPDDGDLHIRVSQGASLLADTIASFALAGGSATFEVQVPRPATDDRLTIAVDLSVNAIVFFSGSTFTELTSDGVSAAPPLVLSYVGPVASLSASLSRTSIIITDTTRVVATPMDIVGRPITGRLVSYTSSTPSVATVSTDGLVQGVGVGSTVITATSEGMTAQATIEIRASEIFDGPVTFASAASNWGATCGIDGTGAAYCWGENHIGQVGDGTTVNRSLPTRVIGVPAFASLAMSNAGACGLTSDGAAYCWGGNSGLRFGNRPFVSDSQYQAPAPVASSLRFAEIVLGANHMCGRASTGVVYCWGTNLNGELGDGTTINRATPAPVAGGRTFRALQSAAYGGYSTCALAADSTAYCWGFNQFGEVGDGSTTNRLEPTPVSGGLRFKSLAGGTFHSCGLTSSGVAYCWGANTDGQLGDGTTSHRATPTPVTGGVTFAVLSADASTCGLTPLGVGYCWGYNNHGQLGDGTLVARRSPTRIVGGVTLSAISAGGWHACGLTNIGAAYCWGYNAFGQLGDGTTNDRLEPAPVSGGLLFGPR